MEIGKNNLKIGGFENLKMRRQPNATSSTLSKVEGLTANTSFLRKGFGEKFFEKSFSRREGLCMQK
jgi:hypothetical protein